MSDSGAGTSGRSSSGARGAWATWAWVQPSRSTAVNGGAPVSSSYSSAPSE
ncbi:hypothetical protein OV079_00925 [Nannocystis pusilla]|uniref:Uncharacterized protein n=1 Tax=Nannocystis pusilla TaxID=889268 RepID=A0A9X3ITM1_9BACT|nr:hypothetical protein [Nannocystis pusilla]MCY1004152.1 hypothetical protein [Nannocystis pusilla]